MFAASSSLRNLDLALEVAISCYGSNIEMENNVHFFLHCPLYDSLRSDLFSQLAVHQG